ncbi:MAG: hypothetical protein AAF756_03510 [Pseudomonadota bacterium]
MQFEALSRFSDQEKLVADDIPSILSLEHMSNWMTGWAIRVSLSEVN